MTYLTRQQARAVDAIARDKYQMPTLLLMENAARSAAEVAWTMLREAGGDVLVLVGPGNNGGDGLAVARHLANAGQAVRVALLDAEAKFSGDAKVNYDICAAMGLPMVPASLDVFHSHPSLVIDGMFGTGLKRGLEGMARGLALATHVLACPVLALDIPSGLDADTGEAINGAAVMASATVTFVAEKVGFRNPGSERYTGRVVVGDIGVPRAAVSEAVAG